MLYRNLTVCAVVIIIAYDLARGTVLQALANVAELVDALDLESSDLKRSCRFDSCHSHSKETGRAGDSTSLCNPGGARLI